MKVRFSIFLVYLLVLFTPEVQAQELFNPFQVGAFNYTSELPKNIRSGKAIAIMEIDGVNLYKKEALMLKLGDLCQKYFYKSGIDVVSYYLPDDLYSSNQFQFNISKGFEARGIENLIYIRSSQDFQNATIIITDFKNTSIYIEPGQSATKWSGQPIETILNDLYKASFRYPKENYLINEVAEIGLLSDAINARRNTSFQTSAGRFNLAVSKFEIVDLNAWEKKLGNTANWSQIKANIEAFNAKNEANNVLLDTILSRYPFKYKLVEPNMGKKAMRNENLLYALFWSRSSGQTLRSLFEYKDFEDREVKSKYSTGGTVSDRLMNNQDVVYKFYMYYVSDSKSTDYYLGPEWDAGQTWEEGLTNHLDYFMTYFK